MNLVLVYTSSGHLIGVFKDFFTVRSYLYDRGCEVIPVDVGDKKEVHVIFTKKFNDWYRENISDANVISDRDMGSPLYFEVVSLGEVF
jgi:hypothetical protein